MKSGPSMMYAQQSAAFSARTTLLGITTDSTPNEPPSYPILDVDAICILKKKIISEFT